MKENIFASLKYTSYKDVKVLLLGQDPYHGEGQAHGMSFSVKPGIDTPPSLKNIYKEISHLSSLENGNWRNDTIKIKHSDENETPHRVSIQKFSKDGKLKIDADYGNYDTYIRVFDENEKPEKVYKFIGGTLRDARIISYNKIEAFEYSHYGDLTSYKDKEKTILKEIKMKKIDLVANKNDRVLKILEKAEHLFPL